MGTKKFPSQVTADTEPTVDTYVLGSGGKIKLSDLIGQGVGVNKVTITGHGQFIEADNGFARITSDWYTVLSAPSAPCVRYIYGDTGFHLVPIDYGGAGLVKINGVADIAVFDMPGLYVLECVSEIAWKVSPAADYDAIDTAIAAAVSPKLDAATFNARNLTAGNGLTGGGQLSADRSFAVGAGTGITVNADDVAITTNGVTDSLLRQSAALAVVGRSANSTGNVADIAAASNDTFLQRVGNALTWAGLTIGMIADRLITWAKMPAGSALSVIGRSANSSGDVADIAASSDGDVLRRSGTTLGFGSISAAGHGSQTDGSLHAAATTSVAGFMSAADKVNANLLNPLAAMPSYGTVKGLFDASGCTDFIAISNGLAPFTGAASGTGAGTSVGSITGSPTNRVGIASLTTGTDTTGRAAIAGSFGGGITFTGGSWAYRCDLNIPTAADVTDTFSGVAGFVDVLSPLPSYGAYFRYQYTENSGNWTCVTVSGGVETTTTTGVAAVHATSYRALEILVNAAGTSVQFWVDGVLKATHTTNIPGVWGIGPAVGIRKSAGTTARTLLVDLMGMLFTATSGR